MGYDGMETCKRPGAAPPRRVREGDVRMPEDLLLELETAAPVAGSLENVEDLVRVVAREMGWAVQGMKESALTFENAWRRIITDVAKGETTEIQTLRPRLLNSFAQRLSLLKRIHALA